MKKFGLLVFIAAVISSLTAVSFVSSKSLLPSVPRFLVKIKGSGELKTERRDVPVFTNVKVGGASQLEIVSGASEQSVEIETDDNLLELTETYVKNDTLHVERRGNVWTKSPLRIRIAVANLNGLDLSGASRADVKNVRTDKFDLELSGASKVHLAGEAATLNADLSGASNLEADNFKTVKAYVDASGASRASVFVTDDLNSEASGASKISYAGNPTQVRKNESGASRVSPR